MSTNPPDFVSDVIVHPEVVCLMESDDQAMVALGMLQADALANVTDAPVISERRIAVLACDGVDEAQVEAIRKALVSAGARVDVVSNRSGFLQSAGGEKIRIDHHWLDMPSVMFDAAYIPGGADHLAALHADPDAVYFVQEVYGHGKALAATSEGVDMLRLAGLFALHDDVEDHASSSVQGIVTDLKASSLEEVGDGFIQAIIKDRHWRRLEADDAPIQ